MAWVRSLCLALGFPCTGYPIKVEVAFASAIVFHCSIDRSHTHACKAAGSGWHVLVSGSLSETKAPHADNARAVAISRQGFAAHSLRSLLEPTCRRTHPRSLWALRQLRQSGVFRTAFTVLKFGVLASKKIASLPPFFLCTAAILWAKHSVHSCRP